jgi:biotin operon repressor
MVHTMSTQRALTFDGATYDPLMDKDRLRSLLGRVFQLMADGKWRTLAEIRERTGGSEASVSARIRDLRKPKFGGYLVEHRRKAGGVWEYQLRV